MILSSPSFIVLGTKLERTRRDTACNQNIKVISTNRTTQVKKGIHCQEQRRLCQCALNGWNWQIDGPLSNMSSLMLLSGGPVERQREEVPGWSHPFTLYKHPRGETDYLNCVIILVLWGQPIVFPSQICQFEGHITLPIVLHIKLLHTVGEEREREKERD